MRRKLKKLISMLTSRVVIIGFLIVLQLVWFVILFLRLTQYATWINITFVGLSLAIELYIINKSGNPSYKILWMLFIGTFPLLGGMMYLLFGDKRPLAADSPAAAPRQAGDRDSSLCRLFCGGTSGTHGGNQFLSGKQRFSHVPEYQGGIFFFGR